MTFKAFFKLLRKAASKWSDCNAPRLGASLAFYMLLSLAPLLIFLVAICGFAFSAATAQERLLGQVHALAGPAGERTMQMLINSAAQPKSGIFASAVAFVTLLFGASGVFLELRESLNTIWSAPKRRSSTWRSFVRQRLSSFGMVIGLAFVLMLSLVLSTAFAVFERFFIGFFPVHVAVLSEVANLPDLARGHLGFVRAYLQIRTGRSDRLARRRYRLRLHGLLFMAGKTVLAIYFATVGVGSTYGAAGSLVALIIWVYYSAQIFFFGAIFTHEYATKFGSRAPARVGSSAPNGGKSQGTKPNRLV